MQTKSMRNNSGQHPLLTLYFSIIYRNIENHKKFRIHKDFYTPNFQILPNPPHKNTIQSNEATLIFFQYHFPSTLVSFNWLDIMNKRNISSKSIYFTIHSSSLKEIKAWNSKHRSEFVFRSK